MTIAGRTLTFAMLSSVSTEVQNQSAILDPGEYHNDGPNYLTVLRLSRRRAAPHRRHPLPSISSASVAEKPAEHHLYVNGITTVSEP